MAFKKKKHKHCTVNMQLSDDISGYLIERPLQLLGLCFSLDKRTDFQTLVFWLDHTSQHVWPSHKPSPAGNKCINLNHEWLMVMWYEVYSQVGLGWKMVAEIIFSLLLWSREKNKTNKKRVMKNKKKTQLTTKYKK